MSGHRWTILLLTLLQLTSSGCQTDGTGRFAWNPFRKKPDVDAVVESETPPVSKNFFARRQESKDESQPAPPMAAEQLERLLSQGRLALQENRIEDARKAYSDVLESLPDNATAHHGLAMAADLTEKWDEAEYHYRQALRIRPRDPDLLCDIGYSYLLQNRYSEAESYLTHALEVSPQHESALMNLAMLDLRQGKRASAERRLADRFGSSGRTAQVMAQLQEQVASLGGGILPVSASSANNMASGNSAFRPELNGIDRSALEGQGTPEVPANASLEEVLEIARREGAEAERRRVAQSMGRESTVNPGLVTNPHQSGSVPHQPSAWPGNSSAMASQNPDVNRNSTFAGQPTVSMPAAVASGYTGQPTHVFGTLQPRNASSTSASGPPTAATAELSPGAASGAAVDPMRWANEHPVNAAPNFLQGNLVQPGGPVAQPVSSSNHVMNPSASASGQDHGSANPPQNGSTPAALGSSTHRSGTMSNSSAAQLGSGAGQGGAASTTNLPNGGAPIAVRSSGAFQPAPNSGSSYGMPYGFGANSGQPPVNTVSNTTSMPMNGQPAGASNSNMAQPASQGMYLDALNVGPGSLFPVYPNGSSANSGFMQNGNGNGASQPGLRNHTAPGNTSMMNGANRQPGMSPASMNPASMDSTHMNAGNANAGGNPPNDALRMGNISSPGSGSMINGAMYSQPNSTLPSAGVVNGGGINTTSNLPGWPASKPAQANPLEAYERQRQQLDDEYNRTLEQLDRNNPTSSSRAQY